MKNISSYLLIPLGCNQWATLNRNRSLWELAGTSQVGFRDCRGIRPPAPSSDVCGTSPSDVCGTAPSDVCATTTSYVCGIASSPTMGRGMMSSLQVCEEPRSWSVDGSRLGLPLGLLCLCDGSASVSSAGGVSLGLE